MKEVERVNLLHTKRDYVTLALLSLAFCFISLAYQYYNYKELTDTKTHLVYAKVLKQYQKSKKRKNGTIKVYQVLKLQSDKGFLFYTIAPKDLPNYKEKYVTVRIWAKKITFLEYLKGFFAFTKIVKVNKKVSYREKIATLIENIHKDKSIASVYNALFLAKPLPYSLQQKFSELGISHLVAISGFHLGVLSALLFFLLKYPCKILQNNYFPYKSCQYEIFKIIAFILFCYMLFLDSPPSLLRAFAMFVIGFLLYERGMKIISMQTLLLTFLLLGTLFVNLLFSIGFLLSILGVFYIFLFLIYFQNKNKVWYFFLLPLWIYLMMLPYSLYIFNNFSLYHPLSIVWTLLFTFFYPLSILLHLVGYAQLLDNLLLSLVHIEPHAIKITINGWLVAIESLISLVATVKKEFFYLLFFYALSLFIYTLYHVTQL